VGVLPGGGSAREVRVHLERDGKVSGEEPSLVEMGSWRSRTGARQGRVSRSGRGRSGGILGAGRRRGGDSPQPAGGLRAEGPFLLSPGRCNYRLRTGRIDFASPHPAPKALAKGA
jgi:hypothetical protein